MESLIEQVRVSEKTPMLTCLLEGSAELEDGALWLRSRSSLSFRLRNSSRRIRLWRARGEKMHDLAKLFDDAYKSPVSLIVLDDIERLLEYVDVGPRFSNVILQAPRVAQATAPPDANSSSSGPRRFRRTS